MDAVVLPEGQCAEEIEIAKEVWLKIICISSASEKWRREEARHVDDVGDVEVDVIFVMPVVRRDGVPSCQVKEESVEEDANKSDLRCGGK